MTKVTKKEYMEHFKKKLLKYNKEFMFEEGMDVDVFNDNNDTIKTAGTIGDLFGIMSTMCFDIPGAVQFALEDIIKGRIEDEFADVPMHWDT